MQMNPLDNVRAMPARQRGSFYFTLITLVLLGVVLTAALKIAPAYVDNNIIRNAIEGMAADQDLAAMDIRDIRASLMRTLNTNNVRDFDAGNVVVIQEDGKEYIAVDYESRKQLFYNIDAVIKFHNRFEKN